MNDLISGHKIDALLYNAQAVTPVTKRLRALAARVRCARRAGDRDAAAGRARLPEWQPHQAQALLKALGGASDRRR